MLTHKKNFIAKSRRKISVEKLFTLKDQQKLLNPRKLPQNLYPCNFLCKNFSLSHPKIVQYLSQNNFYDGECLKM